MRRFHIRIEFMNHRLLLSGSFRFATVPVLGAALLLGSIGQAATLNDFEIDTTQNNVKIILHTDQRAHYTTESNGKQFAVILSDTKLSQGMMKSGLPVVTDASNKWIGRAMPMDGGRVKILLPNLPTSQVAISVLQKKSAAEKSVEPIEVLRPKSAVPETDAALDEIVKRFQRPELSHPPAVADSGTSPRVITHEAGEPAVGKLKNNSHPRKRRSFRRSKPAVQPAAHVKTVEPETQAVAAVAIEDTASEAPPIKVEPLTDETLRNLQRGVEPGSVSDAAPIPGDKPASAVASQEPSVPPAPPASDNSLQGIFDSLEALLGGVPSWVLILSGGLLVALSGFIAFKGIRFMFGVLRTADTQPVLPKFHREMAAARESQGYRSESPHPAPRSVEGMSTPVFDFQDTVPVNTSQFLMGANSNIGGGDIREAVRNTTQLKFGNTARKRPISPSAILSRQSRRSLAFQDTL